MVNRLIVFLCAGASLLIPSLSYGQQAETAGDSPVKVRIVRDGAGFHLLRGGKPYFIKGAGGDASKPLLQGIGGNSFRTWGADDLDAQLAEAQKLGLSVTAGIWLGHKEHGFSYHDPAAVQAQLETARKVVLRHRNSPALLVWALGNEMESGQEDDPAVWKAVEDIAAMTHKLDPNHPTMTVVAEIGGDKVKRINEYCPDIDIVGINSYAGAATIPKRYADAGGVKPYIITEYGPPGTWEWRKTAWGAAPEPTSTEKVTWYRNAYEKAIANQPLCLGSYAFTWGNKQEATATWYGLFLSDGSRLGAVDAMERLWSGKNPVHPCPEIKSLAVAGNDQVDPGTTVHAALDVKEPDGSPVTVKWLLQYDPASYHTGGDAEMVPPSFPDAAANASPSGVDVTLPKYGGGYRLFAFIHDSYGGAAVANVPLFVKGDATPPAPSVRKATLPFVIYSEGGHDGPYSDSGYMGNYAAIKMDGSCRENPHAGSTCLKVQYTAGDNWGGVVWQSPANDWGDKPGGFNITGAKKLTFWARGDKGGETVRFAFGLLKNKPHSDTGTGQLEKVVLTPEWKQYTIDAAGQDLSCIKNGFGWAVAGAGHPITFYLDDIQFE